jgi:hypothetical protein
MTELHTVNSPHLVRRNLRNQQIRYMQCILTLYSRPLGLANTRLCPRNNAAPHTAAQACTASILHSQTLRLQCASDTRSVKTSHLHERAVTGATHLRVERRGPTCARGRGHG